MTDSGARRWSRRQSAAWLAAGAILPAGAAAALVAVRGSVSNTDIALLIMGAVLAVATSGHRAAASVAALSAAVSFDYFHTLPYHSLSIANRNDALATLVLGLLALVVGQIAARASDTHIELVFIAGAAALSQAVPQPARFLLDHNALDVSLVVLVFVTALALPPSAFRGLATSGGRLFAALASGAVVLPALSWAASRLVSTVALRRGVLTVGLAPAEIASVATTSLAGGDAVVAAGMLVGSTLLTVLAAGFALRLLGTGAPIHPLHLLANLALIVGAPMAAGISIRSRVALSERQEAATERLSIAVVTLLVWLVASQVRLASNYVAVTAALLIFLAGSAALGVALGHRAPGPIATAVLLTTSMRDFAIAAGIAVAAFGSASAAPLGLYGVIVLSWGMVVANRPSARTNTPDITLSPAPLIPLKATMGTGPATTDISHHRKEVAAPVIPAATAHAVEADVTALVELLHTGRPRLLAYLAPAVIEALRASPLCEQSTRRSSRRLGLITNGPTATCLYVIDQDNPPSAELLEQALTAQSSNATITAPVQLWLSDGQSANDVAGVTQPHVPVLAVGAVRPRSLDGSTNHAASPRRMITLTLSYRSTQLDHRIATEFLRRVVDVIQTRDWSKTG